MKKDKTKIVWVKTLSTDIPEDAKPDRMYPFWHLLHSVRGHEITSRANRKFTTTAFYLTMDGFKLPIPVEQQSEFPIENVCFSCSNIFQVLEETDEVQEVNKVAINPKKKGNPKVVSNTKGEEITPNNPEVVKQFPVDETDDEEVEKVEEVPEEEDTEEGKAPKTNFWS